MHPRYCKAFCLSLILCWAPVASTDSAPDNVTLETQARSLVRAYVGRLQPTLKQALAEGGPTLAIEVCASKAPKIAQALVTNLDG